VLHFEDQMQLVFMLNNHAGTHLRGGNRHSVSLAPCGLCAHCAEKLALAHLLL
jgi:hypothetical protein